MTRLKTPNRSVATRTTIIMVVIVTIILVTSGLWQMEHVRGFISDEVHRQATRAMESSVGVIDNRMSNVQTAVETAASYADLFASDEQEAYTLLRRLFQSNDDIDAVTLMYRANFFPKHGRYYAPRISKDALTGLVKEHDISNQEKPFRYLEEDPDWIETTKAGKAMWGDPYWDSIDTPTAVVCYSVPLYDKNHQIYAVLCADVGLEWVQQMVEAAKPYSFSEVAVLSRDSQFVCHPNETWVQTVNAVNQARQLKDDDYKILTERMLRGEKGVDTLDQMPDIGDKKDKASNTSAALVFYAPVDRVKWSVCFTMPEDKIMEDANRLHTFMMAVLAIIILVIAVVLYLILRAQLSPLKLLSNSAREIAKGNFNVQLPVIKTYDEIHRLRDTFSDMEASLAKYVEELKQTTAQKASMESELRIASDIQMAMIPKKFPAFPDRDDIDIYASLTPALDVSGDLFDYHIRDEKLFFCIGDVSGKGVPASMLMAVTISQFRTIIAHEAQPERIVASINEAIIRSSSSNMFVTLLVGVLDLPTGKLRYCNAGHEAPLLIGTTTGLLPSQPNIPVGVQTDWKFIPQETNIDTDTNIFVYTDGLTEAEDKDLALFGTDKMIEVANSLADHKPQTVVSNMQEAVRHFVGQARLSDDLTLLSIHYTRQNSEVSYRHSITLANDVQQVPLLNVFVDEVCEAMGFDMTTTMQMNLAIEEAVVNVMNYAYPPGSKGDVHIDAMANDKRLKVIIRDNGVPFDPTAKAEADTTLSAEERPIGGLGIYLVRQLMDTINYERTDGFNVLTLRKKLTPND